MSDPDFLLIFSLFIFQDFLPSSYVLTLKAELLHVDIFFLIHLFARAMDPEGCTVRPRDTRPQAARTSQVHVFELGPKIFEMHVFARFCTILHVFF